MKFARATFLAAGIYGVLIIVPMYFQESLVARLQPPAITHAEFYYGFIGLALAWQVLFLMVSRDPSRYRPMMIPAALEKLFYGGAVVALYLQHRVSPLMLIFGGIDLLFVVLFALAYLRTPEMSHSSS
jgi:hypothetical protein